MDFKNQKAIYLQIAERIMDQILSGQYPEGGKLPSVREYAAEVEVNVNTVARSFEWLQNQDVVVTRRGLGNFVNEGARQIVLELRKRGSLKIKCGFLTVWAKIAERKLA